MQTSPSPWKNVQAFVFDVAGDNRYVAGRTLRAFDSCGMNIEDLSGGTPERLGEKLLRIDGPVLLLRAGVWPAEVERFRPPPSSATGKPLCALGAIRTETAHDSASHELAVRWMAFHERTGGNLSSPDDFRDIPPTVCVYLEPPVVASLARRLTGGETIERALHAEIADPRYRVVRFAPLDVHFDSALRIVQLVTSLQQGGAERIAIDLHRTLSSYHVRSLLVALGSPTRASFPMPESTVDLSRVGPDRETRVDAAARAAIEFAADLVHGHLLHRADLARISSFGLPTTLTVHNMPQGWPRDMTKLQSGDASLLIACSQAVETEIHGTKIPLPARTVWNGIDFAPLKRTPELIEAGAALRRGLGIEPSDFVLLAVANPRPQKRLERLPPILAAAERELAACGKARKIHLLLAGEPSRIDSAAAECEAKLQTATEQCGKGRQIHRLGSVEDLPALFAASDALVSVSAYEGLSLAHLEALAAEIPVVATSVGGTAEIAAGNPAFFLLSEDADADTFANAVAGLAEKLPGETVLQGRTIAEANFSRYRMAEGYARLYPRAIAASRKRQGSGLWLVTNNFSMGGAQSSARRLLLGMAQRGIRVRAAVLEEQAEYPTPGRQKLLAAGVPVLALPPAGTIDPAEAVAELLRSIDADPPEAVLFWNAISQYKILLADALLNVPVFDVSPGEMYFSSLEKYFERPRPGLPYRTTRDYGARLAGTIVKFQGEAELAAKWLGTEVHVVPNGVPLDEAPKSTHGGETILIGTAARISPQKRLEELFRALRHADGRMPQYELHIAGGVERGADDYAMRLREEAEGLPVKFLGEFDDPRPFYRGLDLFAMISEPAGCPNASLEAMACGLPVVATDFGGASEQVVDGVNGRLVPRGNETMLAESLVELASNRELRNRYGRASRERIAAKFDVGRMVDDYCRILFDRKT
jgi:glycosyltransferase involved in cell wall biosynthesis